MKVYKDGKTMNADKEQMEIVLDAGWSKTKPESDEEKQAKVDAAEAEKAAKDLADKEEAEAEKAAKDLADKEEAEAKEAKVDVKKIAKPKKIRKKS